MKIFKICITLLFLGFLLLYSFVVFGVPKIINSSKFSQFVFQKITQKTGIELKVEEYNCKISPSLNLYFYLKNIRAEKDKKLISKFDKLSLKLNLKNMDIQSIESENIDLDTDILQKYLLSQKPKKEKKKFNIKKINNVKIDNAKIYSHSKNVKINLKTLKIEEINDLEKKCILNAELTTPKVSKPIKLGQSGDIRFIRDELFFNNFDINIVNKPILISGVINKTPKLSIRGREIPVKDTIEIYEYIHKLSDPTKKFTENFYNYKGTIDINLIFDKSLDGKLIIHNISANSVKFDVPFSFKEAEFIFANNEINSVAYGMVGTEKLKHTLKMTNLLSKERNAYGTVTSVFTERLIKKYLPKEYKLTNNANAKITYNIKNSKIDVKYYLDLPKGTSISYKNYDLGLTDKTRRIYMYTHKFENDMHLRHYDYSIVENSGLKNIILGEGLFIRKNNKFNPQYIICKTNNFAPISLTGSFGRYVYGGEFKGELKYDFIKDIITGNVEVRKTIFNNFFVKSAKVVADNKNVHITADGKYKRQIFKCILDAKNDFTDKIIVQNMDLFVDKFVIHHSPQKQTKKYKPIDISSKVRNINMDINKWEINVNEIDVNNIAVKDIKIFGNLKDYIFNYQVPEIMIADGNLFAKGKYDFKDDCLLIDFSTNKVDSNKIATMVYNLPNQIQGTASAKLYAQYWVKKDILTGYGSFQIDEGYLPQLGDMEFMMKESGKNKKIKVSKFINIDFTKKDVLKSNIRGQFVMDNYELKDVVITTQQKSLSTLIKGDYSPYTQNGNVLVFGKYDKNFTKGVKVLHIPLSWILKVVFREKEQKDIYAEELKLIPTIDVSEQNTKYFKIKLGGNLKSEHINVELKKLK